MRHFVVTELNKRRLQSWSQEGEYTEEQSGWSRRLSGARACTDPRKIEGWDICVCVCSQRGATTLTELLSSLHGNFETTFV